MSGYDQRALPGISGADVAVVSFEPKVRGREHCLSRYDNGFDIYACETLWVAVLFRLVQDLRSPSYSREWQEARSWIGAFPSGDFREVCTFAGYEPDYLHPKLVRLAESNHAHPPIHQLHRRHGRMRPFTDRGGAVIERGAI